MDRGVALVTSAWLALSSTLGAVMPGALADDPRGLRRRLALSRVIVLEPSVQVEDVRSAADSARGDGDASPYVAPMLAAGRNHVEAAGLAPIPNESCSDVLAADDCVRLHQLSSRLARGNVPAEAVQILERLGGAGGGAVLVQFLRVKGGPGGSWNPWSGAITSSTSTTLMQAALLGNSGEVIWSAEVFVRKTFRPESPEMQKNLSLLYRTFSAK